MKKTFFLAVFILISFVSLSVFGAEKTIALTFDDGPKPAILKQLLPLLEKNGALATFFVIGSEAAARESLLEKMGNGGHEIENHGWGHENFKKLLKDKGSEAIERNLARTSKIIFQATGRRPFFFRPPFWEITPEIEKIVVEQGYRVMKLDNPDINTLDYKDAEKHRSVEVLIERVKNIIAKREDQGKFTHILVFHELPITVEALKTLIPYFQSRGYQFKRLEDLKELIASDEKPTHDPKEIRAVYLGSFSVFSKKKVAELEKIISETNANGIVIDFKDSNLPDEKFLTDLVERFKKHGAYTIARIVVLQDTYFAQKHPEVAIKTSVGNFWLSGRKSWKRCWVDPASSLVQDYNIEIAKRAIGAGFDEIQFDYIRFPTDGDMKNIHFPIFDGATMNKTTVMRNFFEKIRRELKSYSPQTLLGIDLFGEVLAYGKENGIGQDIVDAAEYFDILCPMAYPSHYKCGEFGLHDPNAYPYKTYHSTLSAGQRFLEGKKIIIRPWIQDFTLRNIYGCGPAVVYTKDKVAAQIQASRDLGINGFMLWNAASNFTTSVFKY